MQNQHQNQTKNCRQQTATQTNKQIKITLMNFNHKNNLRCLVKSKKVSFTGKKQVSVFSMLIFCCNKNVVDRKKIEMKITIHMLDN